MGVVSSKLRVGKSKKEGIEQIRERKRMMKQLLMRKHAFSAAHSAYLHSLHSTASALHTFSHGLTQSGVGVAHDETSYEEHSQDIGGVLNLVANQFIKAAKSGEKVSKLLQTDHPAVVQYVDTQTKSKASLSNYSSRMLRALGWKKQPKVPPLKEQEHSLREGEEEEEEDASTILVRLLAWEKKLFNSFKILELERGEYEKKWAWLGRQQEGDIKVGVNDAGEAEEKLERTQERVKKLQESMATRSKEVEEAHSVIQRIRDQSLYLNLRNLVESLAEMWRSMLVSHLQQKQIVLHTRKKQTVSANTFLNEDDNDDDSHARKSSTTPTTLDHHKATLNLEKELFAWHVAFCKMVLTHREFVATLNDWLHLHIITEGKDKKEEREGEEEEEGRNEEGILRLCEEWQRALDRVPDKVASEAIKGFVSVVHALVEQQKRELKQKEKLDLVSKKLKKATASLKKLEKKMVALSPSPLHQDEDEDEYGEKYEDYTHPSQTRFQEPTKGIEVFKVDPWYGHSIWSDGEESNGGWTSRQAGDEELSSMSSRYMSEKKARVVEAKGGDPILQKRAHVEGLKWKVQRRSGKYRKCVQDSRALTMNHVQTGLPGVLEALAGFCAVCSQALDGALSATPTPTIITPLTMPTES